MVGAGSVGGVVGGRLLAAGHPTVFVARGEHGRRMAEDGLRLLEPDGASLLRARVEADPTAVDWRPGDVVLLAVKSQDSVAVLDRLAACAPPGTPVACLQNGVANEPAALRRFARVYGVPVQLPAALLRPGTVANYAAPVPGILDVGAYPRGVDDLARDLSAALRGAGFDSRPVPDVMRWKWVKLLSNTGNAVEAVCGTGPGHDDLVVAARAEARAVLEAAGVDVAGDDEERDRRGSVLRLRAVDGLPRPGGSSWQSLARGAGSVETDYLNGEIVLLARQHGLPAPLNAELQRLARAMAAEGAPPGSVPVARVLGGPAGG